MTISLKRTAFVAAALVTPLANAQAQFLSGGTITGCGGNTFVSCAAWSATASGKTLTFTITNTSGTAPAMNPNSAFTTIELGNVASQYVLDYNGFSTSGDGSWGYVGQALVPGKGKKPPTVESVGSAPSFNGQGLQVNIFGSDSKPGNPAVQGLTDGETVTFTFTFTQLINANDFLNAQVAIHDQGSLEDCGGSSKAVFNGNTGELAFVGTTCGWQPPPPTTVSEPSSMALLGTGLVGLVPMIRRRNKK